MMPNSAAATKSMQLLVVLDHREAKIYRAGVPGAAPQILAPYDPHGFGRHLHLANEWCDGKSKPERKSYYEGIAKTLHGAQQILIFGSGTGKSSAMNQLMADLKEHHADLAKKVIAAEVVDTHHQTEKQLLARALALFDEHNKK